MIKIEFTGGHVIVQTEKKESILRILKKLGKKVKRIKKVIA